MNKVTNAIKKEQKLTVGEDFLKSTVALEKMKVIISGASGKMGKVLESVLKDKDDCEIVAGIDRKASIGNSFKIFANVCKVDADADVIIDFSHPDLLNPLLNFAKEKKVPIVLCTTGYSEEQVELIQEYSKVIPIFYSRNMSFGINLLIELSRKATKVLGDNFDIEIIEKHHNQKIDAPSGTALMIADEISSLLNKEINYVYDRHEKRAKRTKSEISMHSVRGGTIVGEHEVIFAGEDEVITISHSAQSKKVFAIGAVNAAKFLKDKHPGLYDMKDLL